MNKNPLSSLRHEFNKKISSPDDHHEFFINGVKRRKEETKEILSIDYPEIAEVGRYSLEELSSGLTIGDNFITVKEQDPLKWGGTYYLTIRDLRDNRIVNNKDRHRLVTQEMQPFGEELFLDFDTLSTYFLTKKNDSFVIFTRTFKPHDALEKTGENISVIDPVAANYMFRKRFDKALLHYRKDAKKYISLTKDLLEKINSYAQEKNIDLNDTQFLFLDRDAIIFQYIGKELCEKYGLDPSQFRGLLSPDDLEKSIREDNDMLFEAIYAGFPIKNKAAVAAGEGDDFALLEGEGMCLPCLPEEMLASSLRQFERQNNEMLSTYGTYLAEQKFDAKHLIIIDGGCVGTSTTIAKSLLLHFIPHADIHTGLIYGQDNNAHYRDFTVHSSTAHATHEFLERRPKFLKRLLALHKDRKGKVYEQRGSSVKYDPNNPHLDREIVSLRLHLDKSEPTNAKVFCMAIGQELAHEKLGHAQNKDELRHMRRAREIHHEKIYGL